MIERLRLVNPRTGKHRWVKVEYRRLNRSNGKRDWGECDYEKHLIRIHPDQTMRQELLTLFHEAAHYVCLDAAEEVIARLEDAFESVLEEYGLLKRRKR